MLRIACLAALAALSGTRSLAAWTPGDLVLLTASSGVSGLSTPAAIVIRASPISTSLILSNAGITGQGGFDAYRNRVVLRRDVDAFGARISMLNFDGTLVDLPYTGEKDATTIAPAGDGRIYFQRINKWSYIDAAGVTRDVLNVSGTAPWIPPRLWAYARFDPATQSLFLGDNQGINALITKVPLSPDGSRLAGPPIDTIFVTANLAGPRVVGITAGPGGNLFIKIDDNSSNTAPRLLLMNPATLDISVFASSGYFGVGGEVAGAYSPTINAAVVLDSLSDQLRVFTTASPPEGTIHAAPLVSSAGASGEFANMFPVLPSLGACPGDLNNDGQVDDADFIVFAAAYNLLDCADPAMPPGCPADLNNDGSVDDADFVAFVLAYDQLVCP